MSDETKSNFDIDELRDRLIDRGLAELLGGDAPPDLSQRILSAASVPAPAAVVPAGGLAMTHGPAPSKKSSFSWLTMAVAVGLLIGTATLMTPFLFWNGGALARRAEHAKATPAAPASSSRAMPAVGGAESLALDYKRLSDAQQLGEYRYGDGSAQVDAGGTADGQEASPATPDVTNYFADGSAATITESVAFESQEAAGSPPTIVNGQAVPMLATRESREQLVRQQQAGETHRYSYSTVRGPRGNLVVEPQGGGRGGRRGNAIVPAAPVSPAPFSPAPSLGQAGLINDAYAPLPAQTESRRPGLTAQGGGRGGVGGRGGGLVRPLGEFSGGYVERRFRNTPKDADPDIMLMVTPRIIIQEEEEERLGIRDLDDQLGRGPGAGGDKYAPIVENPFKAISAATTDNRLSTFSIDVDTAAYANVRQFLMQSDALPPPDAVRIEELVNYFDYDYTAPTGDVPFAANVEVAACPWAPEHRIVRVGIKGREMDRAKRPKSNLVFLIDVSGSMDEPAKLPLVIEGLRMLTRELTENDRVAIVVYASTEGLVLESTRGDEQQTILDALGRLSAGGSTAGGAGIVLAYKIAEQNFFKDGVNRIVLCTDGDFNVGVTSPAELQRLAEQKAKDTGVFLTVIGFGRGNLNDAMMEQVADHGNGNYHYVDNRREARKVLVEEMSGTLVTIAKDVKIQIEFNPAQVAGYRLIGYENRVLAAEDFNNDKKDAGEIGAGHTVTALYEIVPAGQKVDSSAVDELKYAPIAPTADGAVVAGAGQEPGSAGGAGGGDAPARYADEADASDELLTLKIRYKEPDGDTSTKLEFPITDNGQSFSAASADFQFASAVAGFGMLLRGSQHKGHATLDGVLEIAESASRDRDPHGYRKEFVEMVRRAGELGGQ